MHPIVELLNKYYETNCPAPSCAECGGWEECPQVEGVAVTLEELLTAFFEKTEKTT